MKSYRNPAIPAASRAMNLVRRHHNVPGIENEMTPPATNGEPRRAGNHWRREARANHLRAKRRTVLLSDIPVGQLPVILEISGGSNFVILKEKEKNGECLVQFPDARESIVDLARLEEVYDGTCVFLNPKEDSSNRTGGFWKAVRSMRPTGKTIKGLFFSLAVLAGALFYVHVESSASLGLVRRSLILPVMGMLAAGCAVLGLVQLRHAWMGKSHPARVIELGFIPHFTVTALVLSGWAIVPLVFFNALLVGYFLVSSRVGSVSSRLEKNRNLLVGFGFLLGVLGTAPMVLSGQLGPEMMAASVSLGAYSSWLLVHCDRTWQKVRLVACS
jgi:hypothetical protein